MCYFDPSDLDDQTSVCHPWLYHVVAKSGMAQTNTKERMDILYSKEAYCATEFIIKTFKGRVVTTAGKVNFLRNYQNMQGYILKQKYNKWMVLFLDDSTA